MSLLVFVETANKNYKKTAFEAVYFGSKLSEDCHVLTVGNHDNIPTLGQYGAKHIHVANADEAAQSDNQWLSKVIADKASELDAETVVLAHTAIGRAVAGRVAIRLKAATVTGVAGMPEGKNFQKQLFGGKAIATYTSLASTTVMTLMGNTVKPEASEAGAEITVFTPEALSPAVKVVSVNKVEGTVPLPEAELVVSAGRGMKGPENWSIIEELADALGATTACSRPVADTGWRPHHEHVGQTGIAIRPNLYIAIGISGAIQHLAGVNNSKVIVVINKDPEAPFFKAADYGVLGDLFDVVPRLTEAVRNFKS